MKIKMAYKGMDNSNYMDSVLQTFLLIQSSPDELQVGMVDSFLNNQVRTRTILQVAHYVRWALDTLKLKYSDGRNNNWNGITVKYNYDDLSGVAVPTITRSQFNIIKSFCSITFRYHFAWALRRANTIAC